MNEAMYIALNIGLAILIMILIRVTNSPWAGVALIIISKWRIFTVRPRFWLANMQADLVSTTVGLSFVIFLYLANTAPMGDIQSLIFQIILVLLYIAWLLFLKPKSKRPWIAVQSGIALFVGMTAVFSLTYDWPSSLVVLLAWLVGCAASRHVLSSYDEEPGIGFLTLSTGLVMAEIAWISYHWTIAYSVPFFTGLMVPQVAIVTTAIGFLLYKCYDSYYNHQKIRLNDILLPMLLTVGVIVVLMLALNGVSTTAL